MKAILRFLFPLQPLDNRFSIFLLAFRILFGVLLMTHGLQKLINFTTLQSGFPDPLGLGSTASLCLAIFAELACSLGFVLGVFYRLALIPMMFTMVMAFFVIHGEDPFAAKELPFVYLLVFVIMYAAGPGRYALDHYIALTVDQKDDY